MPVAVPEHTVDIWTATIIDRVFPTARLWAPTQLSSPDFDLASQTGEGKLFVLENKAPYTSNVPGWDYEIEIDQRQLFNYLSHDHLRNRTFYVLPCPPFRPEEVAPATAGLPPAPRPVLIPAAARYRGTADKWFRVIRAADLWTSVWPGAPLPLLGNWWSVRATPPSTAPRPRSRLIDPCGRTVRSRFRSWPLSPDTSLSTFLGSVRACEHFNDLYWPGEGVPPDEEHLLDVAFLESWSQTALAILVERDSQDEAFPNWRRQS